MTSTTSTKTTTAKKTPATKIPAKTTKAPAKAAQAKAAPATKAPAAKAPDAVDLHLAQALAKAEVGTFITARALTNAKTKAFPKDDVRPSVHVIFNRCRTGRLPAGVAGQAKPCGATRTA